MPTEGRSLHRKLAEVMGAVGFVPKRGNGPGYSYATATDVADRVRDELAKRHVTLLPVTMAPLTDASSTTLSGKQSVVSLLVTWRFTDAESGETVDIQSIGTGADTTDKASSKASTAALKYAMLLSFAIPTGDDPEASAHQEEERKARPRRTAAPAEYPAIEKAELDGIMPLLRAVLGAADESALKAAGVEVGKADLSEPQRAYLQAAYRETRDKLRESSDVAA